MFEVTFEPEIGAGPHIRRFSSHVELASFLEQLPSSLGFLSTSIMTITIKTVSTNSDLLFDLPATQN